MSSNNVDPDDPVYIQQVNKFSEQLQCYNQIMKDAQKQIKLKEAALKEIDGMVLDNDANPVIVETSEKVDYNFMRKKGKSLSVRRKLEKELIQKSRATDEGKERNRKAFAKYVSTDKGKEKNRYTSDKIRPTDEGKENLHLDEKDKKRQK